MKNLKDTLKRGLNIASTGAVLITYYNHIITVRQKEQFQELERYRKQIAEYREQLHAYETNSLYNEALNVKAEVTELNLSERMHTLNNEINKIKKLVEESNNTLPHDIDYRVNDLIDESKKIGDLASQALDLLTSRRPNFISDGSIFDMFKDHMENMQNILSQLNGEALGAAFHLIFALYMFFCVTTILGVLYGEFLIEYFKLEERYPRIARYLQIRRKFQRGIIILEFVILIILLLIQIFMNLLVLSIHL